MSLAAGTRIGSCEIVALIGAGGMGEVYRARDTKLARDVAVKIVRDDFAGTDRMARFQREAQVLAGLNHPNIGAIYGLEDAPAGGAEKTIRALVLELVDGPTLANRIALGPIPLDETLTIARQVAEAVSAAHDHGVIHRDLKPANIKLRPDGTVKVLDFGLAKVFSDESGSSEAFNSPTLSLGATRAGVILGTAAYMSPEQARGKAVDKRTDVWAFGCVVYEMLAGRRAFGGDEVSDTLAFVITKDIDWNALPASTPPAIRRLLARCLEKDRNLRLRDIGDACLELRDAASPQPESSNVVRVERSSPKRLVVGVALALVAGAAITAGALWAMRTSPPLKEVKRFAITMPAAMSLGTGVAMRTVAVSPDGRHLAIVGNDGRLFLRALDGLDLVPVPMGFVAAGPFFSPDSRSLAAFAAGTSELRRMPVTGGPAVLMSRGTGVARGATWAPDGTIFFATTDTTAGLLSVPASGGSEIKVVTKADTAAGELDHLWPEILPDGRALVFTITRAGGLPNADIAVLDLKSGAKKILLRGGNHAQYLTSGHLLYGSAGALRVVSFDPIRLETRGDPATLPFPALTTGAGAVNAGVSNEGMLVYAPGAANLTGRRLLWVDRQGREEPIGSEPEPFAVPRASPDGTRVAAHLEYDMPDVAVFDIRRRSMVRLTLAKTPSVRPAWTPDGRWVYFRSDLEGPGIYRKAADGSGAVKRITSVVGDGSVHAFSPDGKSLVYTQIDAATQRDLWMIDAEGTQKPQPLIVEPGDQANAAISPDGRWIAYHSSEIGEIYVRPFPNVADGRWQVVASGAKWPLWSRDGKELFYLAGRGIASVEVEATQTFQWSSPKHILDASYFGFPGLAGPRNYDLSPDGKRFLVINEVGRDRQQATELVVVENWFEELKRLAPPNR